MSPSATEPASQQTLDGMLNQLPKNYGASDSALQNLKFEGTELNNHVLKTFRCLIADLCEQFKGGHPGSAMGMAAIGKYLLSF
jgi:dihydroxyacetone synthase